MIQVHESNSFLTQRQTNKKKVMRVSQSGHFITMVKFMIKTKTFLSTISILIVTGTGRFNFHLLSVQKDFLRKKFS